MVPFVFFVIFVLLSRSCHGIICVGDTQMQLLSFELTLTNIEKILNDLKTSEKMMCQVHMKFDSISRQLIVKFGRFAEPRHLRSVENVYIDIGISIASANSKTKMNFVCHNDDKCDRQLVLDYFDWLIKRNYIHLKSIIRSLIFIQDDKKDECTVGNENNVKYCNGTACSWHYSTDTKQGEGKCENEDSHKLPILSLSTEIRMFVKHKEQEEEFQPIRAILKWSSSIKFWCELNNCNNQTIGELVKNAVNKHYDLWEMHLIPVNPIEYELSDEEKLTPATDSISSQTNTRQSFRFFHYSHH